MRILILINGAPGHRPFYSSVGDELARRGHEVVFALDSHWTDFSYPDSHLRHPAKYLSDYFERERGRAKVPVPLQAENLWLAMFPDFDRANSAPAAAWRDEPGYYADLLAAMTSFFWGLFEAHGFERVVYECVSNAFSYVAYIVARHFGAEWVGFSASRLPRRFEVATTQYHRDPRMAETYRSLVAGERALSGDTRGMVDEYLANFATTPPDYMRAVHAVPANPLKRYLRGDTLRRVFRALRYRLTAPVDQALAFQVPDPLKVYPVVFRMEIHRTARLRALRRRYYQQPTSSSPYYVYPMQFHPESSTSVNAPYYVDELTLVRNISMSLPWGTHLYVKDHQAVAAARQPLSFYEEVSRMPNVTLVDPSLDGKKLVAGSLGVIASTSTMGYEAIVLGKPVFLFGHTFYDFHPLCVRVASYGDLFEALSSPPTFSVTPNSTAAFVGAYFLCTYPGTYDLDEYADDRNLIQAVASVVEAPPRLEDPSRDALRTTSDATA